MHCFCAENGPFKITEDLELCDNKYGWDQVSNLLYVDQPINTGFSYSSDSRDRVYDEVVVAAVCPISAHILIVWYPLKASLMH